MKKIVLKVVGIENVKSKRRAMKTIAGVEGVEYIAMDTKEKKITVIGEADPVCVVLQLRKFFSTALISLGPAKEEKNCVVLM